MINKKFVYLLKLFETKIYLIIKSVDLFNLRKIMKKLCGKYFIDLAPKALNDRFGWSSYMEVEEDIKGD